MSKLIKILKVTGVVLVALIVLALAVSYQPELSKEDLKQYWQAPSQFITLPSGATIHYRDQGNPDGPIIVMIHGQFGSLYNWEQWVPYLKDDYRLITADMPGHGLTGRIPGDFYSRGNISEVFEEFFAALNIEKKITVVGNSAGGDVMLYYTIQNPEKVEGVVLIGSGGTTTFEDWQNLHITDSTSESVIETMERTYNGGSAHVRTLGWFEELALYFRPPGVVRLALGYFMVDPEAITDELVQQIEDLTRYEGNRFAQALMGYHGYAEVDHDDLIPYLPDIKVPTLLLWGSEDHVIPVSEAREFDQLIEDTHLVIYDGVGHMCQMEIPERSARDLDAFMKARIVPAHTDTTGNITQ